MPVSVTEHLRSIACAVLPPLVTNGIRSVIRPIPGKYDTLKTYETFDLALADSDSYAHPDIVTLVAERTRAYAKALAKAPRQVAMGSRILQNLFVLTYTSRTGPLQVAEFGGACGATFFELDRLLPSAIDLWNVVELPATVDAGRRKFESDRLHFFDRVECAVEEMDRRDLLMTQGGLQVAADPLSLMARLLELKFAYVYFTWLEVSDDLNEPLIVRQVDRLSGNGPGTFPVHLTDRDISYPATILPLSAIIKTIPAFYQVAFTFTESEPLTKVFGQRVATSRKIGFLLERAT